MNIITSEVVITAKELRYLLERLQEPLLLSNSSKKLLQMLQNFKYPSKDSSVTYQLTLVPIQQETVELILAALK